MVRVQGEPARAARLLGAAANFREAAGSWLPGPERARVDGEVAILRQALGEEAFAAAWEAGRALTLDQSIAQAFQAAADPPAESATLT